MPTRPASERIAYLHSLVAPIFRFVTDSTYSRLVGEPGISDFALGNPHEMPLPGFVEALQHWIVPQNDNWFAYKLNEPEARGTVAASLAELRGLAFDPDDIFLTNGAFAALTVSLGAIVDPGDEVIFVSPPWFFYEAQIAASGGIPVRVRIDSESFDLDLAAIEAAITPRTRALIVNSPNNPTGRIYPPATLEALASLLTRAGERHGRAIYVLSDESYSRIVFDGRSFVSPAVHYPWTLLIYTYGKTLLTPGQRLGYIALPPTLPDREALREAIFTAQFLTGFAFPNALLQHALPDLEKLSIDVVDLQRKRDRLVGELRDLGYEVSVPEGTFYLLARSPLADDWAFCDLLGERGVLCLPGRVFEMPGYFRMSLTASWDMIERALPAFASAIAEATARRPGG